MREGRGNSDSRYVTFFLGDIIFEYDDDKNSKNVRDHGLSFKTAARVFFDYYRIEMFDEDNSIDEDRYNIIGDLSVGYNNYISVEYESVCNTDDIVFVVYTERFVMNTHGKRMSVIRLISARYATNFERGLYYGKY